MTTVFSKIIQGALPAYKVAENNQYLAFLDIAPVSVGHTLVIPKLPVDSIFNLDTETYIGLQLFAKQVAQALQKAVVCERIGVLVLGLEIPHAHIHLIPIKHENDLLNFSKKLQLSENEFKNIQTQIAQHIQLT